jgi:hypothetical protein
MVKDILWKQVSSGLQHDSLSVYRKKITDETGKIAESND